ncbi:MAG TPA: hypothetical protein VFF60_05425 [Candidatus Binatus sp.]|nr:hypothetical protein [Candidatus Binatus sp.]
MKVSQTLVLMVLVVGFLPAAAAGYCTNPRVTSMKPTGDGQVEIVVKNAGSAASPKSVLQLTYVDDNGKNAPGPKLRIAPLKPGATATLHAKWPASVDTINTTLECGSN